MFRLLENLALESGVLLGCDALGQVTLGEKCEFQQLLPASWLWLQEASYLSHQSLQLLQPHPRSIASSILSRAQRRVVRTPLLLERRLVEALSLLGSTV